jgi:hypothetical protein
MHANSFCAYYVQGTYGQSHCLRRAAVTNDQSPGTLPDLLRRKEQRRLGYRLVSDRTRIYFFTHGNKTATIYANTMLPHEFYLLISQFGA